jgi:hypothetical protein
VRANRALGLSTSFGLAAVATFIVTSSVYGDLSHPTIVTIELIVLLTVQALRHLRLWVSREMLINLTFFLYSLLSLLWTENIRIASPTIPAMLNFIIILTLFSSLLAFHHTRAALAGMSFGFLAAAAFYTLTSGWPFTYPEDFSYNTIAGMYLFGFFTLTVYGVSMRWTVMPLAAGLVCLVLIAATTSIKTNLGVLLGLTASSILYFRFSLKGAIKGGIVLAVLVAAVAYVVLSNPTLTDKLNNGLSRVSLGVGVLTNREGDSGSTGLGTREGWKKEGLKGWAVTPVFGHGVEAFRADFGITSHSTPIDTLYNAGIIGCGLFYALLASIAWRLLTARNPVERKVRARIATCVIAYTFISLSGIMYYDGFLAMFLGVSSALLMRSERAFALVAQRREHQAGIGEARLAS